MERFTKHQKEHFESLLIEKRQKLFELKQSLDHQIRNELSRHLTGEVPRFSTHPADVGSHEVDRELATELEKIEENQLNDVEAALMRIRSSQYGICEECANPIPTGRLEILPEARLCVECEEMSEAERKENSRTSPQYRDATGRYSY